MTPTVEPKMEMLREEFPWKPAVFTVEKVTLTDANRPRCVDCGAQGVDLVSVERQISGPSHNDGPSLYSADFAWRSVCNDRKACRSRNEQRTLKREYAGLVSALDCAQQNHQRASQELFEFLERHPEMNEEPL